MILVYRIGDSTDNHLQMDSPVYRMTAAVEKAYGALLGQIQRGELASGAFLVESDLARALGVSRTPVREALRRLAADGLVLTEGHRRAVVREFSEDQVQELYELRARLESYAAARAATRLDAAALERCAASPPRWKPASPRAPLPPRRASPT